MVLKSGIGIRYCNRLKRYRTTKTSNFTIHSELILLQSYMHSHGTVPSHVIISMSAKSKTPSDSTVVGGSTLPPERVGWGSGLSVSRWPGCSDSRCRGGAPGLWEVQTPQASPFGGSSLHKRSPAESRLHGLYSLQACGRRPMRQ